MAKVRMLISVRETHLGSFDEIARAAERAGMEVDARMSNIGVLSGLIEADRIDALRAIDGVADVEGRQEIHATAGEFVREGRSRCYLSAMHGCEHGC